MTVGAKLLERSSRYASVNGIADGFRCEQKNRMSGFWRVQRDHSTHRLHTRILTFNTAMIAALIDKTL
jgi:hypothetical protein